MRLIDNGFQLQYLKDAKMLYSKNMNLWLTVDDAYNLEMYLDYLCETLYDNGEISKKLTKEQVIILQKEIDSSEEFFFCDDWEIASINDFIEYDNMIMGEGSKFAYPEIPTFFFLNILDAFIEAGLEKGCP